VAARIQFEGVVQPVMARGNRCECSNSDDEDLARFTDLLGQIRARSRNYMTVSCRPGRLGNLSQREN